MKRVKSFSRLKNSYSFSWKKGEKLHSQWKKTKSRGKKFKSPFERNSIVKFLVLQFHKKINKFFSLSWLKKHTMNFKLDVFFDLFWDHVTYLWQHNETYSFAFARDEKHETAKKKSINTPYRGAVGAVWCKPDSLVAFHLSPLSTALLCVFCNWSTSDFSHKWSISKSHFHSFANEFYLSLYF